MNLDVFISLCKEETVMTTIQISYSPITKKKKKALLTYHNYKKISHKNILFSIIPGLLYNIVTDD